jgi:hypothetical protein
MLNLFLVNRKLVIFYTFAPVVLKQDLFWIRDSQIEGADIFLHLDCDLPNKFAAVQEF